MPANLTPMYHKAEREYRRAATPAEQLACLETMLQLLPKHKGTDKLQADIKRKLKETRAEVATASGKKSTGPVTRVPRQGCGQVAVIGGPNAGKSQLVATLTGATPEVAPYPFTTRTFTPGMLRFEDVSVQLIDTPPIAVGSLDSSLLNLIRVADLVLWCVDGSDDDGPEHAAVVLEELNARSTRLTEQGGYVEDGLTTLGVPTRVVLTRAGTTDAITRLDFFRELTQTSLPVWSFDIDDMGDIGRSDQMEDFPRAIFRALGLARVYTKKPGQPVDRHDPYTLPIGSTIEDVATKVHADVAKRLRYARAWKASEDGATTAETGQDGQTVGREHSVTDGDIVELHT